MANSKSESKGPTSRKAADAAQDAIEQIAGQAEAAEERVRDAASDASAQFKENADAVRARGKEVAGNVQTLVHEHPIASLGVAFVAGVVIASLLRR